MSRAWEWWLIWLWSPVVLVIPALCLITAAGALMEWLMPSRRHAFTPQPPCPPRHARQEARR